MLITSLRLPTWRPAQIEIRYANEDIGEVPFEIISRIKKTFDCCIEQNEVVLLTGNVRLWNAIKDLKKRGVRVRFVTTVNEGNIASCKQLMKVGEVFHNDGVKGAFQIVDRANYLCYITENEDKISGQKQEHQLFYTSSKSFVDIQQYLFDNLCNKAISAKERIKEIERGLRHDFADTITEPAEIRKIVINQLMSAKDEILLLFSTSNSYYRAKYGGMLNLLRQIPNDVTVKVLIQAGDDLEKDAIREELRRSLRQIRVQYIRKPLQTKIVSLVVDQATSVAIEISDDTKETFEEATGPAIYSNSEMTVSSCIAIFETLWVQSELDKQNKIKQAYFQMFKGLKLKDETYMRRWSFEQEKGNGDLH
jgi:phosphatidylserine/phosphatidylglycerophosphate/cardiolipin synthase-like enzyme